MQLVLSAWEKCLDSHRIEIKVVEYLMAGYWLNNEMIIAQVNEYPCIFTFMLIRST